MVEFVPFHFKLIFKFKAELEVENNSLKCGDESCDRAPPS
jgi:hypothetical protein